VKSRHKTLYLEESYCCALLKCTNATGTDLGAGSIQKFKSYRSLRNTFAIALNIDLVIQGNPHLIQDQDQNQNLAVIIDFDILS
jgi:hypothetical protein